MEAKDFPAEEETTVKAKAPAKKPVVKKPVAKPKVVVKPTVKKVEKPADPEEAEALKLYNEAIAKGINPADIGNQAGDIVSGSDKKVSEKDLEAPEKK